MRLRAALTLGLGTGCATPSSSAWSTGSPRPTAPPSNAGVRVLLVAGPVDAQELGVVEAHGPLVAATLRAPPGGPGWTGARRPGVTLEAIVEELRRRVASIGGDLALVDRFAIRYETVAEPYAYECSVAVAGLEPRLVTRAGAGGPVATPAAEREPRTCTGTRWIEVATFGLTARALRSRGAGP